MPWSGEHRGFVVEAFFKHGESVTATQRAFHTRFGLRANDSGLKEPAILLSRCSAFHFHVKFF
jgi:hypothetical protein